MENYLYRINKKGGNYEIGYFIQLKDKKDKNRKSYLALITSPNVLKDIDNNSLKIIIDDEPKSVELGDIRYENKEYNKAVIEIKNKDDIKYIFELDDNLNKSELEISKNYYRKSIYIIQYDDNNNILLSSGVVIDIFKKQIKYLSNINPNIKDNIIFNQNNNKIIGINDSNQGKNGMLFNDLIYKFIYKINHKLMSNRYTENISRINITVYIKKNEINKEIYFLDNYYYDDDGNKKYTHDHLNELDEHNTK